MGSLSQRVDVTSPKFYEEFRKDLCSYKKGDLGKFIKDEFGIDDIMSVGFPQITDAAIKNFNMGHNRGYSTKHHLMTAEDISVIFSVLDEIKP